MKPGFMPALQRQRQLVIPVKAGPAAVHAGRAVRSGTGFGIMGMRHRRDSVLTFDLI